MSETRHRVVAVARNPAHEFSKHPRDKITLLEGLGVEGDAHCGVTVKHRSRVAVDPTQANLRQVHLLPLELLEELAERGFAVVPAQMGENITTEGIDLIGLPRGTRLRLGDGAVVEVTGLRNPCAQIETFRAGLLEQVVGKGDDGSIERRVGVMGVVLAGGDVAPGDAIGIELPPMPHAALERV